MSMITITHRWNQRVLWQGEAASVKNAVLTAIKTGADLTGADLRGAVLRDAVLRGAVLRGADLTGADLRGAVLRDAVLRGADLTGADLRGADLTGVVLTGADLTDAVLRGADLRGADLTGADLFRLPTGETWAEYLTETVPALLTAGGKSLESFADAWQCHSWDNCPMAHAFSTTDLSGVPLLLRPRAEQFIQFFDARLIPWPLPTGNAIGGPVANE
jgi:uncharacterized protein YjbI with pentapeptide repeats